MYVYIYIIYIYMCAHENIEFWDFFHFLSAPCFYYFQAFQVPTPSQTAALTKLWWVFGSAPNVHPEIHIDSWSRLLPNHPGIGSFLGCLPGVRCIVDWGVEEQLGENPPKSSKDKDMETWWRLIWLSKPENFAKKTAVFCSCWEERVDSGKIRIFLGSFQLSWSPCLWITNQGVLGGSSQLVSSWLAAHRWPCHFVHILSFFYFLTNTWWIFLLRHILHTCPNLW